MEERRRTINVRIPFHDCTFVEIPFGIVEPNVPLLVGLSDLKNYGLLLNYLDDAYAHA